MREAYDATRTWAHLTADQFDKNAAELRSYIKGWLERPQYSQNLLEALRCATKADAWEEAARELRRYMPTTTKDDAS